MSLDNIVQNYELLRITHQEAETLGPALLTYLCIAKHLQVKEIHISGINLRDGLLQEMALEEAWSKEFQNQIIGSVAVNVTDFYIVCIRHIEPKRTS